MLSKKNLLILSGLPVIVLLISILNKGNINLSENDKSSITSNSENKTPVYNKLLVLSLLFKQIV